MTARRDFLRRGLTLGLIGAGVLGRSGAAQQQEPLAGQGDAGMLRDPGSAGRARERATARDNDEVVKAIERRLQCTCGCTLDIYTCRTTDFTCTYSPQLHREVMALMDEGKTPDEVIQAFVAKYGEDVLMAPKPEGFNIAGYVVPGIAILAVGAIMTLVLRRRMAVQGEAPAAASGGETPPPAAPADAVLQGAPATREELERLERELREFDQ